MNAKKLSLVMLYHNESSEVMKPMLNSLENQTNIDWNDIELLVCSSQSNSNDPDFSNYPNINRIYRRIKEDSFVSGPGASWQLGVDHALGEYVWRIDSDDELYDNISLSKVFKNIEQWNFPNFLIISFSHDTMGTRYSHTLMLENHYFESATWAWVYKTQFLKDYKIRINKYCLTREDMNYTSLTSNWTAIVDITTIPTTDDVVYHHIVRTDSTYFDSGVNHYKVLMENYYHYVYNINYYKDMNFPINHQLYFTYINVWHSSISQLEDGDKKAFINSLTKQILSSTPTSTFSMLIQRFKSDFLRELYQYGILIHIDETTSLNELKLTLMSIQCQSEELDHSKMEIVCYGKIPEEIQSYDFSKDFATISNAILFIDETSVEEAYKIIIPDNINTLICEAGYELPTSTSLLNFYNGK